MLNTFDKSKASQAYSNSSQADVFVIIVLYFECSFSLRGKITRWRTDENNDIKVYRPSDLFEKSIKMSVLTLSHCANQINYCKTVQRCTAPHHTQCRGFHSRQKPKDMSTNSNVSAELKKNITFTWSTQNTCHTDDVTLAITSSLRFQTANGARPIAINDLLLSLLEPKVHHICKVHRLRSMHWLWTTKALPWL